MADKREFTPHSSLSKMLGKPPSWWPEEERERIQSYEKYDQMYWNDPTQYAIRVLDNEEPLYIPNARIVVNTTSQYLLKGLSINAVTSDEASTSNKEDELHDAVAKAKGLSPDQRALERFLKRERFYSKHNINKQAGVTRGDSAYHVRADPTKPEGSRVSLDTLHPGMVYKVPHPDDPEKIIRIHIVEQFTLPEDDEVYIRKLTYHKITSDHELWQGSQRIAREEAVYKLSGEKGFWWGPTPEKVRTLLEFELLPESITQFPIYWFNNIEWESQLYGSSELRGLEFLEWAVSQGATDTQAALALEGLGVYATDGGRPVDNSGNEVPWEVNPGGVMEVPSGAYFRRVEGVGSITPMMDQLKYIESKMYSAAGMTDVAQGQVDVQVAQSGIALAIKFMPTLARIENRDTAHVEILQQMFYDLRSWFAEYDPGATIPEVDVLIDKNKLPSNRTDLLNELNNMYDRKLISKRYYRQRMAELGHLIPADEDSQLLREAEQTAKLSKVSSPIPSPQATSEDSSAEGKIITNAKGGNNDPDIDEKGNQSNNRNRPNESSGTEAS